MQTTKLKRFATEARNKLRQGVANRLVILGFDEAGTPTVSPELVSGGSVWGEKPCNVAFYRGFKALEEQIRQYGVNHVVEEAAYTWFNRLMAIRILTMNGLCEPVLRYVGSTRTPLIVDEARQGHLPEMEDEDRKALMRLLDDDTKTAEQFAMLISAFCHNTPLIDKCFEIKDDYTDVLFPANLLTPEGFLDSLNSTDFISEEDYKSSELLGWLYQFYISEKKDQVFAKKGKYDADDIPAATQIFTPNWIVKYMVQNTIGGILGGKDKLQDNQRKYYVETPAQPKAICHDLEDMKVADLACGSGHILNECFDLLYDLYISEGYTRREAIECIFTQNLTGIDIDTRAKQLATFALMLKACQRDSSLVDASLMPRVYDMSGMPEESRELGSIQIFDEPSSKNPVIAALSTHYDAIVMNPPYMNSNSFSDTLQLYVKNEYNDSRADLMTVFMEVATRLTKDNGYWAMINLPSWMFLPSFETLRHNLIVDQYIVSLLHLGRGIFGSDFGSVSFVVKKCNATNKGIYRKLMRGQGKIQTIPELESLFLQQNYGHYESNQKNFTKVPGSPIAFWISENFIEGFNSNLKVRSLGDAKKGLSTGDNNRFLRLWFEVSVNNEVFESKDFNTSKKWFPINKGGNYRRWYGNNEYVINWKDCGAEIKSFSGSVIRNEPYYLKECLTWTMLSASCFGIRYSKAGKLFEGAGPSFFASKKENLGYILGLLSSIVGNTAIRILNPTVNININDVLNIPVKFKDESIINDIVTKNVSVSKFDWDAHETSWDFEKNPLLAVDEQTYLDNVNYTIERHRQETGEELCVDPAAPQLDSLKWRYEQYCQKWESLFMKLHANEEELNRRFIEVYGLQDELTPDVPLNEITILQQGEITIEKKETISDDGSHILMIKGMNPIIVNIPEDKIVWHPDVVMKQFISYAVGCMMGRYRLDRPGLAIAHPNETPEEVAEYEIPSSEYQTPNTQNYFWIDTDGIIPLLPEDCGFHDNAANRLATFVRQVMGEETQTENLNFIEECLGKSIEQYFMKDFWKDHKKMYQNRPIYWLFASKKGAFQVLVYVHRMNVATVERIRSRYLLPYIERLNKRIDDLQANESTLSTKQRNQLKTLRAQVEECSEYHNRLAVIAEQGIVPNLDDGIIKNHARFGDVVTKLK